MDFNTDLNEAVENFAELVGLMLEDSRLATDDTIEIFLGDVFTEFLS